MSQWLTQEAFDRLALELENLSTVARAEIVKRIELARAEGDLKRMAVTTPPRMNRERSRDASAS